MRRSPTIGELKAGIKRLKSEIEEMDIERGYCPLPFQPISDIWAEECYQRHWQVVKPLLVDYASLVLESDEFIPIRKDEQVREWMRALEVASNANDTILACECTLLAYTLLPPLISGDSRLTPALYADMVAEMATTNPYHISDKERYTDGYNSDYNKYYEQKREELDRWQNAL